MGRKKMRVILASSSPRRKELLKSITEDFEVIISDSDESFQEGLTIEEQSKRIAYLKAKTVFDQTQGDRIVIGADTMVLKDRAIYGKPKDKQEAYEMLSDLQNAMNEVITGVSIIVEKDGEQKEYNDYDIAKVYIVSMKDREIQDWVNSGKAMDKAGAYAVQEEFSKYIEKIEGNYATVVGLPIHKVYQVIKQYLEK
ncbi:MAG: septum formation protein Maf [Clostridia bacterium]|nr:septum formation protein Maf [Clostridia bacterium]